MFSLSLPPVVALSHPSLPLLAADDEEDSGEWLDLPLDGRGAQDEQEHHQAGGGPDVNNKGPCSADGQAQLEAKAPLKTGSPQYSPLTVHQTLGRHVSGAKLVTTADKRGRVPSSTPVSDKEKGLFDSAGAAAEMMRTATTPFAVEGSEGSDDNQDKVVTKTARRAIDGEGVATARRPSALDVSAAPGELGPPPAFARSDTRKVR